MKRRDGKLTKNSDYTPIDILLPILYNLPVKSLLRFKSVSKPWYSMISSPEFAADRDRYASCFEDNHRVMLKHCLNATYRVHVSIFPDKKDETLTLEDAPVEPIPFFEDVDAQLGWVIPSFSGSCHGVVCVAGYNDPDFADDTHRQCDLITLWNPKTTEMKRLPVSRNYPPGHDDYSHLEGFDVGFGYDPKGRDYKVVKILHYITPVVERTVEVYSLKTDTWRQLDVDPPDRMGVGACSSVYLDGFFYWWEEPIYDPEDQSIVCFDFANEVMNEIYPPHRPDGGGAKIITYKGSVALLAEDADEDGYRATALWVLNKDKGINTWAKLFMVVSPHNDIVGIFRNGNVLIHTVYEADDADPDGDDGNEVRNTLAVYDISSGEVLSTNDFDGVYDYRSLEVVNYVESHVSFKRAIEIRQAGY